MARVRKLDFETAPVVKRNASEKCLLRVSIQEGVIINRIRELWAKQGCTTTEPEEEYPLDTITLQKAQSLYEEKGMVVECKAGHVLGVYREPKERMKKGVAV